MSDNTLFYNNDLNPQTVDNMIEAFDGFCESTMEEAIKHMTAKEKLDAKMYRKSATGKKAIAKYLKKSSRAGYKVDKELSKKMKKVAKLRREDVDIDEYIGVVCNGLSDEELALIIDMADRENATQEQLDALEKAEELMNHAIEDDCDESCVDEMEIEDLADIDRIVEEMIAFAESDTEDVPNIDPETGEELDEFKHMSAQAKLKARKYRNSASGKKAIKKYLKKASRNGYRVNKKRSKLASKVGKFALHDSKCDESMDSFDTDFIELIANAPEIIRDLQEEGIELDDLISIDESEEVCISVPFSDDEEEQLDTVADETDCEIKSKEDGVAVVKGEYEDLRSLLDKMGYEDDSVEDLIVSDEDDMDEAYKRSSAAKRMKQRQAYKRIKNTSSYKKARAKYARKRAKSGYHVDKTRSREMTKIAKNRVEAIESTLDAQFISSPIFGGLNESETTELKSMMYNAMSDLLAKSSEKIASDLEEAYEEYNNNEFIPSVLEQFELYKDEMMRSLYESVDNYLTEMSEEIVEELSDKKVFVKSAKTETLENFAESLIDLIQSDLKIIPEREDALESAQNMIESLTSEIQDMKIAEYNMKKNVEESKKESYMMSAIPSEVSESMKEQLISYANDVLDECSYYDFKRKFDSAIDEAIEYTTERNYNDYEEDSNYINESTKSDFNFMEMFGRK